LQVLLARVDVGLLRERRVIVTRPLADDQGGCAARRRCGASRAALWLEALLARARRTSMRASPFGSGGSSSASRLSGVDRNPSRALRVAWRRWPTATPD
jgi:hypothetical protein